MLVNGITQQQVAGGMLPASVLDMIVTAAHEFRHRTTLPRRMPPHCSMASLRRVPPARQSAH